jgi:ABC-type nitrate/sulfonate/bicarbonate transport system substrate-binding protein
MIFQCWMNWRSAKRRARSQGKTSLPSRSRRCLFLRLAILAVCLLFDSSYAQQKPKLRPLRIALPSHSVSSTPIYIARSLGIFESYGYEPQILVLEPRAALAALLTGDLDFYTAAGTTGRAALRGVPVRVVMVSANRSDLCVVAAKEFTSVEQLRGKTFGGYTAQASANIVLIELLRRKGLRPDEYKILNIGTARAAALISGNVPAAVLTAVEAARLGRQGFRVLARASDDIELSSGGLGTAIASLQNKRDVMRSTVQAALEGLRIAATQKDKVIPIYMKQFALTTEEAGFVYDNVARSWALDGRPTANANKLDFELTQRDMGLKEPPKLEQIYDFSLLDELAKR